MTNLLLASFAGAAGMAALYGSWRRWPLSGPAMVTGAWLLLLVSLTFWIRYGGAEFGTAYGFVFVSCAAWLAVVVNHEVRDRKGRAQKPAAAVAPDPQVVSRHLLRFVVAVPIAAVASAFAGVALVSLLAWSTVNASALAVMAIPAMWGLASWWACADPRVLRPALSLLGAGVVAAAFVLVR